MRFYLENCAEPKPRFLNTVCIHCNCDIYFDIKFY